MLPLQLNSDKPRFEWSLGTRRTTNVIQRGLSITHGISPKQATSQMKFESLGSLSCK